MTNPCKCIDCGGDQPTHSSDCTYMAETFGPEPGTLVYSDMGVSYVPHLKPGHYVAGTTAALDMGYNKNPPAEWKHDIKLGDRKVEGTLEVYWHNPEILRDMFSWEKAITSNTGLTKRQMDILRNPQSHAADPLVTVSLIRSGLLDVRKRWTFFGQPVVVLTRAGRREQKKLPPECYRSKPSYQQRAENDCESCPAEPTCLPYGSPTQAGTF